MNYQPKSNYSGSSSRQGRLAVPTKIAFGLSFILLLLCIVIPHALGGFFMNIFSPLWRLKDSFNDGQVVALQQQLAVLDTDSASITLLEQENAELKTLLGRTPSKNTILAVVLKKPPFSAYDDLIVDVGSNDSTPEHTIAVGNMVYVISASSTSTSDPALSSGLSSSTDVDALVSSTLSSSSTPPSMTDVKIPIGVISQVYSNTSTVSLFSAPDQKYDVEIGKDHILVSATSRGAGNFEAVVPRDANINVGDVVVIPSIEPLAFATVSDIISDPARPYATVLFQSPVNPFNLYWVEVETKKAASN